MEAFYCFESLSINTMASGHLCMNLTDQVSWDEFPVFAETFLCQIGGTIIEKSDGPDLRLWKASIDGHPLRLVFDDFPVMVSLESSDDRGDLLLERLHIELEQKQRKQ